VVRYPGIGICGIGTVRTDRNLAQRVSGRAEISVVSDILRPKHRRCRKRTSLLRREREHNDCADKENDTQRNRLHEISDAIFAASPI
jgi:hypothetical protein